MFRVSSLGLAVAVFVLVVWAAAPAWAVDHYVSAGQLIQPVINDANDGDVVIVAHGTYTECLDFGGKAITLRGDPCDPCAVVLDGSGLSPAGAMIAFINEEEPNSVVEGFTITGGRGFSGVSGGAIVCWNSAPTIRNCRMVDNSTPKSGGAVYLEGDCRAVFSDCIFEDNSTSTVQVGWGGGAVYSNGGIVTFYNCQFNNNTADNGGAICLYNNAVAFVNDCVFRSNEAVTTGGALYCYRGTATVIGSRFTANHAGGNGGALAYRDASARITNCILHANTAAYAAGGYLSGTTAEISYCAIVGNTAATNAGGLRCLNSTNADVRNCIVYYNSPNQIQAVASNVEKSYCDIQGGGTTNGNFDAAPGFVAGWSWNDPADYEAANAFRLNETTSPCVDAGDPNAIPLIGQVDIDGDARYCGLAPDVGVDETAVTHRVHNVNADSWYVMIDDALADANDGDELVVNPGLYQENVWVDRAVTLRGVRPGLADAMERTIIDGSGAADPCDAATVNFAVIDPCRVVLAGLTIIGGAGFYDSSLGETAGGGIYVGGCETLISYCMLRDNEAARGGAIGSDATAQVTVTNSVMVNNTADDAAIYAAGQCEIDFCTIKNNAAAGLSLDGVASVRNSIIWANGVDPCALPDQIAAGAGADVTVSYCVMENAWTGSGEENLSGDPLFAMYEDDGGTWGDPCDDTEYEHNWQLKSSSPCINAGDPLYTADSDRLVSDYDCDVRGQERTTHCRADIGAYEVEDVSPFGLPGVASTLLDSYCTIQEALDNAPDGTTVSVGLGRYVENVVISGTGIRLRAINPTDPDSVAGTIIDGSGHEDSYDPCAPVYGSAVTLMPLVASNITIEGFTLTGGTGYYDFNDILGEPNDDFYMGGGLFSAYNGDVIIKHCRIIDNAAELGGGIYAFDAISLEISNCVISQNHLDPCTGQSGGGIRLNGCSDVTLTRNLITANSATLFGDGLYAMECSGITMDYSVVYGNSSWGIDGEDWIGEGVHFYDCCDVTVWHNIVWGNYPDGLVGSKMTNFSVTYCDVQGGYEGLGNFSADPCFVRAGYWDPNGTVTPLDDYWVEGDYHLRSAALRRPAALPADFNDDGRVNLHDYVYIAGNWLDTGEDLPGDIDGSGTVDIVDLMQFSADFLTINTEAIWTSDGETSPCIDAGQPNRSPSVEDWGEDLSQGENIRLNLGLYGGTSEAVPGPIGFANQADVTNDGFVDLHDWAEMSRRYSGDYSDNPTDLDRDGQPSMLDAVIIADNWLWQR
ncbi:MAG: right-handed parallel beta-helix repeat-containing protein [Sedimentisphaerales bacterium]|nr:right-handed parallel beta-helix repeat-containing protein [Sedimentisphaerales bacterium]